MLSFYFFPEAVRVAFSLATVICAAVSALVVVLLHYRSKHGLPYWRNGATAFLTLCQAILCVALIAQVQHNVIGSFIVPGVYILPRYIVFAVLVVVCVLSMRKKQFLQLISVSASFLTLPIIEVWTGRAFPAAFTVSLLIILISGVWSTIKIRHELRTDISGLSVVEAMDSLDTAILFNHENGQIILVNRKMQELMIKTAGSAVYDGRRYLEQIGPPDFTKSAVKPPASAVGI